MSAHEHQLEIMRLNQRSHHLTAKVTPAIMLAGLLQESLAYNQELLDFVNKLQADLAAYEKSKPKSFDPNDQRIQTAPQPAA